MCDQNQWCRAQAELDGIQEDQTRMAELGIGVPPLQAAELERRQQKVAKLVKVSVFMTGNSWAAFTLRTSLHSRLLSIEDVVLHQLMYIAS